MGPDILNWKSALRQGEWGYWPTWVCLYTRSSLPLPPSPLLLSAAAFRNLPPAFAFLPPSLFGCLDSSRQRGRESGLSQRAKEGLLLAQLSDLQRRHMTRPEWLPCAKTSSPLLVQIGRPYSLSSEYFNNHISYWLIGLLQTPWQNRQDFLVRRVIAC